MKRLILVLITILSVKSNASPLNVTQLNQGDKAPFSGYLFTPEMEEFVRFAVLERDVLVKINEKQNELIDNYQNQVIEYKLTQEELEATISKERTYSTFEKIVYGVLGVAVGFVVGVIYAK